MEEKKGYKFILAKYLNWYRNGGSLSISQDEESNFNLKDIEKFASSLVHQENTNSFKYNFSDNMGIYIFNLINSVINEGEEIKLDFSGLEKKIDEIGSGLTKGNIRVKGAIGDDIGKYMQGGKVYLFGPHGKLSNSILGTSEIYEVNIGDWNKDLKNTKTKKIYPVNEDGFVNSIKEIGKKYASFLDYGK